jgi:hypothetical protein
MAVNSQFKRGVSEIVEGASPQIMCTWSSETERRVW